MNKYKVGDEVRVIADKKRLEECHIRVPITGLTGTIDTMSDTYYDVGIGPNVWALDEQDLELAYKAVPVVEPERVFIGHPGTDDEPGELEVKRALHGHPRFYEILEQMKELHSRKNHDYAGASDPLKNLRACKRLKLLPFMGVMVRLQDKWSRLEEFVKSGTLMVKDESVKDTLMDNAVYSVLAIILYEEQQKEDA